MGQIRKIRLTDNQKELFFIIKDHIDKYGKAPTITELSIITGKARSTIWETVNAIALKGKYIKIDSKKKRGIKLVKIENDGYRYHNKEYNAKEVRNQCRIGKKNQFNRGSIWK